MHRQLLNILRKKAEPFSGNISVGFMVILIAGILIVSLICATAGSSGYVVTGQEYCIVLSSVDVMPTNKVGSLWDSDNTAPDIFVRMYIDESEIYCSSTQNDTCTARWQQRENKWGKMFSEGTIKAALCGGRITVNEDQTISIGIYDSDFLGEEIIGALVILTTDLHEGINIFRTEDYPENLFGRIRSIELTVLGKDAHE